MDMRAITGSPNTDQFSGAYPIATAASAPVGQHTLLNSVLTYLLEINPIGTY